MSKSRNLVAVLVCGALTLVACSRSGSDSAATTAGGTSAATTTPGTAAAAGASFGDLQNVCQPGTPTAASDQGVTATEINVGVFTDMGFTKVTEFPDTAEVFTKWCNDAGGINGRKLVFNVRDARLTEDRQRMLESCKQDFAVVGGGAAFDQAGVKERLKCLLPEIPGQVVAQANIGSDLQVGSAESIRNASMYEGYYQWLMNEEHPGSGAAIGIIAGDAAVTQLMVTMSGELFSALGANVVYTEAYPASGASDWTPYAQSIKDKGVKGLVFIGAWKDLVKLEQSLSDIGYTPDWIDANSNAYSKDFLDLAGPLVESQHNYVPSSAFPIESAADSPAVQQLLALFEQYKPGADIGFTQERSFAAFLLFALAARDCGDNLTRRCLYENALTYTEWTGGGLLPPTDVANHGIADQVCWTALTPAADGWHVADVKPDNGAFRCTTIEHPYATEYGKPATLADVGKSLDDLP